MNFVLSGKTNFTAFWAFFANPKSGKTSRKISHFPRFYEGSPVIV